jgi:hypothetical protein
MRSSPCKTKLLSLIIGLLLFISCEPVETADQKAADSQNILSDRETLLSKIKPITELIANEQLSIDAAVKLVGGRITESTEKYLALESNSYKAVLIKIAGKEPFISEISLYMEVKLGIKFRDLVSLLGEWKPIRVSKTSTVLFDYKDAVTGNKASVYVDLLDTPSNPVSPVISIKIRHEPFPGYGK